MGLSVIANVQSKDTTGTTTSANADSARPDAWIVPATVLVTSATMAGNTLLKENVLAPKRTMR